jgi:colanic acid/amylovoran biosynthesis glycosyltransferase
LAIGYILWEFPVLSETFITREIAGLLQLGVSLHIYAIRRPSPGSTVLHEPQALMRQTTYFSAAAIPAAHAYWLKNAPGAYVYSCAVMMQTHRKSVKSLCQGMRMWMYACVFARHAEHHGIRHFHAHFGNLPASAALGIAALLGTSFSFSIHGYDLHVPDQSLVAKAARARFILACNEYGRDTMLARAPELAKRILLHHHGIPLECAHQSERPGADPPLILAVGRLVAKKGFTVLLQACALLKAQAITFRTVIIGEGPERHALTAQIQTLGLQHCVELLGEQPPTGVWSWYPRASVFVLPSQIGPDGDQDGLPNVILEALACSCSVVATTAGSIPEVISDGETGLLVPPQDPGALKRAIQWLLSNPDQSRLLGQRGQALVQRQFDLKISSQRLAELFRRQAGA